MASEQEVIRYTKKLAQMFELNEQNAEVYSAFSGKNRALKKQLEDYHFQHNTLERRVKRLKRDVKSLKVELEDLDKCVDRKTVINLIYEIALLSNIKKCKDSSYLSESFEKSDLVEIIEIRKKKAVSHKQRKRAQPRKVKRMVV